MAGRISGVNITATTLIPSDRSISSIHAAENADFARTQLVQNTVQVYGIDPTMLRVWDNLASLLPTTAAADDLGIVEGTFGSDFPTVQTSDAKATTVTQRAAFLYTIPPEYDAAETFQIIARANMVTTVSDGTATLTYEVHKHDGDGAVGANLCSAAQSINSLTVAEKTFTITATDLSPGDQIIVRETIAITDTATGTAVIGEVVKRWLAMDIRG